MEPLHDLTLPLPLPDGLQHGLLFGAFALHIVFVLMMLGTAILGLSYFIDAWWHNRLGELRWDKKILRMFLAHKSLAVVLGIGPLLLIQVSFTIPFFTAIALLTPFWLLIIGFLIVAFISFDSLGHRMYTHHYLHLGFGVVAMITLLCVPGFFVAILVATENPNRWMDIFHNGFAFDRRLSLHWILRYLHVLGAGLLFGAAFHYFFTARLYPRYRTGLRRWMLFAVLSQVVLGVALYGSLLHAVPPIAYVYLGVGGALTVVTFWLIVRGIGSANALNHAVVLPVLLTLLVTMLLVRQEFQDQAVAPLLADARQAAVAYQAKLQPYEKAALAHYHDHTSVVYDSGPVIYAQSCAFCHGQDAKGDGPDAKYLHVAPEDLSAIRAERSYVMTVIDKGVAGSAMPRFMYYELVRREQIIEYLNETYGILTAPSRLPTAIPSQMQQKAKREWDDTCSRCHGTDGRGTKLSEGFRPAPPDFSRYSLTAQRVRHVIENGYPGTTMSSYASLGDEEIDALADHIVSLRSDTASSSSR
jgi:mono/diheme cytochrome c family protein